MSNFQVVLKEKIIGYDSITKKVFVYKPQEVTWEQLSSTEVQALVDCIEQNPNGGNIRRNEI